VIEVQRQRFAREAMDIHSALASEAARVVPPPCPLITRKMPISRTVRIPYAPFYSSLAPGFRSTKRRRCQA
jgi:hypothetical protein